MKAGAQEFLDIQKTTQESGAGRTSLAIVSPCGQCKNQRSMPEGEFPACPRRYWDRRLKETQVVKPESSPAPYLTRNGRRDDAEQYENPVNWEEGGVRLVWIANLEENRAMLNGDGSVKNPDLLSPGFNTEYIVCRHMPYIPMAREGAYYGGEQLVEKNFVLAQQVSIPQYDSTPGMGNELVQIGGFVQKIAPMQKLIMTPGKKSVNPKGT